MAMTIQATEAGGLEPGNYTGVITDIVEQDGMYQGEETYQYKFVIAVDDETKPDGSPVEQWAYCNRVLSSQSKLWSWIHAVSGRVPLVGTNVDIEEIFLGKRVGFTMGVNKVGKVVCMSITKAKGTAATARAVPGQQEPAPAATEQLVCAFPKCGRPAFSFDDDGNAICPKHGGNDE